jgi:hypothetical protein
MMRWGLDFASLMHKNLMVLSCVTLTGCVGFRTPLDDGSAPTGDAGISCKPGSFGLSRAKPTVMLVLDRSTSMDSAMEFGRNTTRWTALTTALASVLPPVDNAMAIGALVFPSGSSTDSVCSVASSPSLLPATGNVTALTRLMANLSPSGRTPTATAIDAAAAAMLGLRTATTGKALVLATDGAPDCNADLNARTCRCVSSNGAGVCSDSEECLDDTRTEAAIAKVEKQGLPTYVVGIQSVGDNEFSDVLNAMAVAGGRPQTGAGEKYYAATSQTALNAALATIRDQAGACTYLTTSVPDEGGTIVLSLDGSQLTADEWQWSNRENGEIALLGDACSAATVSQSPDLSADIQCSGG